jgi:hypothetical protein
MRTNEQLGYLLHGRTIEIVTKEEGLVTIIFDDRSKLQIKVIGAPDANMLGESRIVGIEEEGDKLILFGEEDRMAVVRLASPGSSVSVKNREGQVEYLG